MSRLEEKEEGIRIYLRIRPPPTAQQSRLLSTNTTTNSTSSGSLGANIYHYEVEEDFQKSILRLHTSQRLVQEGQRANVNADNKNGSSGNNAGRGSGGADTAVVNNTVLDFRYCFDRVFKPSATQEDVFNTVAKDCVSAVLNGINSTVFAYGQTGSGKTYSITGGTESYQDRGLIPRAMAMIYEEMARRRDGGGGGPSSSTEDPSSSSGAETCTIAISYLQIYNDKGQDLLNHGHDARTLEELPPVFLHELEEDVLLKGLEQHSAPTLPDALNLLFLGDTNRLYCETPMNKTSSRSHCIFTVSIEARSSTTSMVRRSKLNLVDLAGSERVSKTGVTGTILTEAKHINLSLHFLEQVIVALSEKAKGVRDHVPYRNSFLTMALRDSLGRNSKTAMLATAHVVASQVAETISTCQFAQRVALIRQAPQVNIETDPVLLVRKLKAEVAQLKDEVAFLRGGGDADADRVLSEDEKKVCRGLMDAYVQRAVVEGDWITKLSGFNGDLARMLFCYEVLRERLVQSTGSGRGGGGPATINSAPDTVRVQAALEESESQVAALRRSLHLKENELQMMLTVLKRAGANGCADEAGGGFTGPRHSAPTQTSSAESVTGSGEDGDAGAFSGMDTTLRQRIYQEAQVLLHRLRSSAPAQAQRASMVGKDAGGSARATEAAAQAALTRVTALAQQGQLTEAEATAATEFLENKQRYHQQQQQRALASPNEQDGSVTDVDDRTAGDVLLDEDLVQDRAQALEAFKSSYDAQHKVEETKQLLKSKYDACKATAQQLNGCVDAMKQLKTKIQRRRAERAAEGSDVVDSEERDWLAELSATKERYNACAAQLRQQKEEVDGMHVFLKHAQANLLRDFERWLSARQQQVQLAVQQQQRQSRQATAAARQTAMASDLRSALDLTGAVGRSSAAFPNAWQQQRHPQGASGVEENTAASERIAGNSNNKEQQRNGPTTAAGIVVMEDTIPGLDGSYPTAEGRSPHIAHSKTSATGNASPLSHSARAFTEGTPEPSFAVVTAASARALQNRLGQLPTPLPVNSSAIVPANSSSSTLPLAVSAASSARTLDTGFRSEPRPQMASGAGGVHLGVAPNVNGWVTSSSSSVNGSINGAASSLGAAEPPSSSPTRPYHLQPLSASPEAEGSHTSATTTTDAAAASSRSVSNPFFPLFPSTGNAAADEQLAQLYKAREAMRQQLR